MCVGACTRYMTRKQVVAILQSDAFLIHEYRQAPCLRGGVVEFHSAEEIVVRPLRRAERPVHSKHTGAEKSLSEITFKYTRKHSSIAIMPYVNIYR